jgi:hypothetical protein
MRMMRRRRRRRIMMIMMMMMITLWCSVSVRQVPVPQHLPVGGERAAAIALHGLDSVRSLNR